jgi:hypothetical protein
MMGIELQDHLDETRTDCRQHRPTPVVTVPANLSAEYIEADRRYRQAGAD